MMRSFRADATKALWAAFMVIVVLSAFGAWSVGRVISEQRQIIEQQRVLTERSEERTQIIQDDIKDAIEEIRQEIRIPAGQRLELFEELQESNDVLDSIDERLSIIESDLDQDTG